MTLRYLLKRVGLFLLTVWVGLTLNFLIPGLWAGDPIGGVLGAMQAQGANVADGGKIIEAFRARFGLDEPIYVQYAKYLWALAHFDLGLSIAHFPTKVTDIIATAVPYTLGPLTATTITTFVVGILAGALLVWQSTPSAAKALITVFLMLAPIPYYLLAMFLFSFLAFSLKIFPASGVSTPRHIRDPPFHLNYFLPLIYIS